MHRDTIEVLLIALARAGLSSFLGGNHNYAGNIGDAHILEEMTTDSSSKAQDFWFSMGGEVRVSLITI